MFVRDTIYAGRKMKPGKYVANPSTGRMGIFLGYCPDPNCRAKFIADRAYVEAIAKHFYHERKTIRYRMLHHYLKKYDLDHDHDLKGIYGAEEYLPSRDTVDTI